jgi:hypothetical protein
MAVMSATDRSITLRALMLGQHLETRGLEHQDTMALMPLTLRIGRQGVAVLASLRPRLIDASTTPEID